MTTLFPARELPRARAIAELGYANPFTEDRIRLERQILGEDAPAHELWIMEPGQEGASPHLRALAEAGESCLEDARRRLAKGVIPDGEDWRLYRDVALYVLYYRVEHLFFPLLLQPGQPAVRMPFYRQFQAHWQEIFGDTPWAGDPQCAPDQLFALSFQIRRAFHYTYRAIFGTTRLSARLRADVWRSIFTHDLRRYRQGLYRRMHEISTLILGPSGTGKELVAQAIGFSRFIPFHPDRAEFEADYRQCHRPVHLAALPATLLESELFGHRKGAYTGAIADRSGILETRHDAETIFLDEIGELPPETQVKLLRVLQSRQFCRLGDNRTLEFHGRIVSATHRDLGAAMTTGSFREDLYYRLCSDIIRTPTLSEQLREKPEELDHLLKVVSLRLLAPEMAGALAAETSRWLRIHLPDHDWPGNMRELEQCLRGMLVRGEYHPPRRQAGGLSPVREQLAEDMLAGRLSQAELTGRYYALVYARTRNYEAAARQLGTDWRTVKARLDPDFFNALQPEPGSG